MARATGCARPESAASHAAPPVERAVEPPGAVPPTEPPARPAPTPEPAGDLQVALLDPVLLREVEQRGFGLGALVRGRALDTTEALNGDPGFRSMFDVLREDLRSTAAGLPGAKFTSMDGVRLFDARWLASSRFSFGLVGVFNRFDPALTWFVVHKMTSGHLPEGGSRCDLG